MSILGNLKEVGSLLLKAGNMELYEKIVELQGAVAAEQEEKEALRARIAELERIFDISDRLSFSDNRYWLDTDGDREGPFCSRCWDVDRNLVRLHDTSPGPSAQAQTFHCPSCDTNVYDPTQYY